jgi:hypothetical protein
MSVKTVEIPMYTRKQMKSDKQIDSGIDFFGFFTSSPAEAIMSKPIKPKKHFAAPFTTPSKPNGKNPPLPKPSGTFSDGIDQLARSSLKHPHTMTKMMTETLTDATKNEIKILADDRWISNSNTHKCCSSSLTPSRQVPVQLRITF